MEIPKNLKHATRSTRKFNKVPRHKVIIHTLIIIQHTNRKQLKTEIKQKEILKYKSNEIYTRSQMMNIRKQ